MSKLSLLIRRLGSSDLIPRLTKPELCLSLNSFVQLGLQPAPMAGSVAHLLPRALQFASLCTVRELAMIAEGANALHWDHPRLWLALLNRLNILSDHFGTYEEFASVLQCFNQRVPNLNCLAPQLLVKRTLLKLSARKKPATAVGLMRLLSVAESLGVELEETLLSRVQLSLVPTELLAELPVMSLGNKMVEEVEARSSQSWNPTTCLRFARLFSNNSVVSGKLHQLEEEAFRSVGSDELVHERFLTVPGAMKQLRRSLATVSPHLGVHALDLLSRCDERVQCRGENMSQILDDFVSQAPLVPVTVEQLDRIATLSPEWVSLHLKNSMENIRRVVFANGEELLALFEDRSIDTTLLQRRLWQRIDGSPESLAALAKEAKSIGAAHSLTAQLLAHLSIIPAASVAQLLLMIDRCSARDPILFDELTKCFSREHVSKFTVEECADILQAAMPLPLSRLKDRLMERLQPASSELSLLPFPSVLQLRVSAREQLAEEWIVAEVHKFTKSNPLPDSVAQVISLLAGGKHSVLVSALTPLLSGQVSHLSMYSIALLLGCMEKCQVLWLLRESLERAVLEACNTSSSFQIAEVVVVLSEQKKVNAEVLRCCLLRLIDEIPEFDAPQLVKVIKAIASLPDVGSDILTCAMDCAASKLTQYEISDLAKLLDALSCFTYYFSERVVDAVVLRAEELLGKASEDDIANFVVAAHRLDTPEFDRLLRMYTPRLISSCDALERSTLPAVLNMLVQRGEDTKACEESIEKSLAMMTMKEIASIAASFHESTTPNFASLVVGRCLELLSSGVVVTEIQIRTLCAALLPPLVQISAKDGILFLEAISAVVPLFIDASEILSVAQFLCAQKIRNFSLMNALFSRLAAVAEKSSARYFCSVLWYLASLTNVGDVNIDVLHKLSDYAVDNAEQFTSGKDIIRMLHCFAKLLPTTKRSLFLVFSSKLTLRPILGHLDKDDIAEAINTFGAAKFLDKTLFLNLTKRAEALSTDYTPADLVRTVTGYSRLHLMNDEFYAAMIDRAEAVAKEFTPTGAVLLLGAFGKMGVNDDDMAEAVVDGILEKIDDLSGPDTANVLIALCKMGYSSQEQFTLLSEHLVQRVDQLDSSSIYELCTCLQEAGWKHSRLLKTIAGQAAKLFEANAIDSKTCRAVLDTLSLFLVSDLNSRNLLSDSARITSRESLPEPLPAPAIES